MTENTGKYQGISGLWLSPEALVFMDAVTAGDRNLAARLLGEDQALKGNYRYRPVNTSDNKDLADQLQEAINRQRVRDCRVVSGVVVSPGDCRSLLAMFRARRVFIPGENIKAMGIPVVSNPFLPEGYAAFVGSNHEVLAVVKI